LHKTLQIQLQEELELEKALAGARAHLDSRTNEATRVREQVKETEQRYAKAISRVDEQLAPLGHHFDLATAKQVFAELRERAREYRDKEAARAEAARQVDLLSNKAEQVAPQLEKLKQELSEQEQQLAQATQEVEKLEQQLSTLLGGQSLEELRTAVEDTLAQAEAQGRTVEEKWHEIKSQVTTNEQRHQDRQLSIERLDTERQALEQRLLPALQSLGYDTPASAQAHRLTPAEEEALEAESQAIRLALAEHDTAQKAARQQRDKWKEAAGSEVEELRVQLREQEASYQQQLRQLGQLEEKQAQAEKRAAQHASLLAAIDKQRQEFNRWAQLNELIGQADGKKFRTFAQGLTLQKLVALANAHLERLNGRYLIHKRPEADLELDIIDTFQADNRRSMYTLSGGESFLVSLALALGLSDLAGKQAQIQSLFIDEGFGTLDEHSLDLALDTLENLQSSGKTIGVISHVKALKERIGVQVQIEKGSNGFSKLQVV
jgi:exonuclease SbcC